MDGRAACLNPLHCGAVVASRFRFRCREYFRSCFNPLHCGAVVASRQRCSLPESPPYGFNPLHCGAVVASLTMARAIGGGGHVSIPFIAGQWSLPGNQKLPPEGHRKVSIPFIAGQWSLPYACVRAGAGRTLVSIPFIAGQWSLHVAKHVDERTLVEFQSPSLRGSGRFSSAPLRSPYGGRMFQSPSLRGSGRFPPPRPAQGRPFWVSIPFIAGQWSLRYAA